MSDDLQQRIAALSSSGGTQANKRLSAPGAAPAIPARSGTGEPKTVTTSSGGGTDMTLSGAKTYQSTDGLITVSFPNSAQVVIDSKTLTLPAIVST